MHTDNPIYLDYNATTPVLPEVVEAMLPHLRGHCGNPSSSHVYGRRARVAVDTARRQVAELIGCAADEIVFTSGGTEANNLALHGATEAAAQRRQLVTSTIEHPSVAAPCAWLERHGWRIRRVEVNRDGCVNLKQLTDSIGRSTGLVTIMHSNNETAVLQPIATIARAAHQAGALVHTDAAQSVGKVPVDIHGLEVDLLSIAGHKLYAPKGVGALYVRRGTTLKPFTLGAGHEQGLRPGTENVAAIVGLGVACEVARRSLDTAGVRMSALRDQLWTRLSEQVAGLILNGHVKGRLPNTLNVCFPKVSGTALLAATPEVAASTGSACHDGNEAASAVLLAMGVPPEEAIGSVRLTLGCSTIEEAIERAADALSAAWTALTGISKSGGDSQRVAS
jgi:cysteine desulfurase